jgi:hypothetical protein
MTERWAKVIQGWWWRQVLRGEDGRWRLKVREATEYEEERWMVMRAHGRGGDVL